MPFQDLSKEDKQRVIDDRINVSSEIFASCLAKANSMVRNEFSTSTSTVWHEQDKNRAVDVAKLIFSRIVTYSDVKAMAKQVHTPEIQNIKLTQELENGNESILIDEIGSF